MTDREKLIDVFMHLDEHIKYGDEYGICYTSDFVKAVETVLRMLKNGAAVPQWIPVTERLPEPFVSVLGYCPDEDPLPAVHECYINGFGQWTSSVVYGMGNVTHWMEMPKPPEDGGAENE